MSVLELRNVTKTFGGVVAVYRAKLEFRPGSIYGLIGPNGAGKTTVFNLIGGQLRPDGGEIVYRGELISGRPAWRVARGGVGRLFQDVRVFDRMTALDNVLSGFQRQEGENLLMAVFARPRVRRQEAALLDRAMGLLESVGLAGQATELAVNLSYGQQKLLALARLLATGADALLLDEPTAGVSPQLTPKIIGLMHAAADEGKTVVVIEHNMNLITEHASKIFFMDEGRVITSGVPAAVLGSQQVRAAYLGV